MMRTFARVTVLALLSTPIFAQPAAISAIPAPTFQIADVHPSPGRRFPFVEGGLALRGDRLVYHQATMLDLISAAYGLDPALVTGGPSWLETNRFEVIAKAPPTTSKDTVKLMLQSLLAERFNLVVHNGTAPLPAYVLSVGKGKPKLKEGDSSAESDCQYQEPPKAPPGTIQNIAFVCHNTTMAQLTDNLHDWANGYLSEPVVDSTGLKGAFDFDIKWTGRGQLQRAGADGISIFDAVDKQLGLKLDLQTAPRPVLVVDSVNQTPTPNSPDLEKSLPTPPPPQFEVATIKPSQPAEGSRGRINGNQVDVTNSDLKFLINFAWDLNPNDSEQIANAPKWLDTDHFDILAKVSSETQATSSPNAQRIDIEDLRFMVRALIEDRFQMKSHMEDRPIDAYTLIAVNPKLHPADPLSRTRCKEGPGPDGKDPRTTTPILGRLLTCQNMTSAQIADELQRQASGYIFSPVLDKTGLKGSWDFTLSFSTAGQLQSGAAGSTGGSPATDGAPSASEPNGALSLFDAVNHQLGLKLEKQRRPAPVLVIDHIEEKPTEN
ncbi:MAG: TIGR03435 family protein [Edaphobacter sp.]